MERHAPQPHITCKVFPTPLLLHRKESASNRQFRLWPRHQHPTPALLHPPTPLERPLRIPLLRIPLPAPRQQTPSNKIPPSNTGRAIRRQHDRTRHRRRHFRNGIPLLPPLPLPPHPTTNNRRHAPTKHVPAPLLRAPANPLLPRPRTARNPLPNRRSPVRSPSPRLRRPPPAPRSTRHARLVRKDVSGIRGWAQLPPHAVPQGRELYQ